MRVVVLVGAVLLLKTLIVRCERRHIVLQLVQLLHGVLHVLQLLLETVALLLQMPERRIHRTNLIVQRRNGLYE